MAVHWLYADDDGETHLTTVELPPLTRTGDGVERVEGVDQVRMLKVPTLDLGLAQLDQQLPDMGVHAAPVRRIIILMAGAQRIRSTSGDSVRMGPGDCLVVDDVGSSGHYSDDLGEGPIGLATIQVPDDWVLPWRAPTRTTVEP